MKHKSRYEVMAYVASLNQMMQFDDGSSEIFEHISADELTDEQLEMIWFANDALMNAFNYRKRIFASICDSVRYEAMQEKAA